MKKNISSLIFLFLNLPIRQAGLNFLLFLILLVPLENLTLTSCSTLDPKLEPDLKLELKDVSCTEAWIQLTTNNIQIPATINLLKNNSLSKVYILNTQDSLLYIDSLLPNQTYKLLAAMQPYNNASVSKSNELNVTTMDTTSHNFTWQTFTFGQHSSSTLYDVAIINENDIWAVGEIYMNDTLGNPDPACYNAVHWDGQRWELKKIGGVGGWACHTVLAFSANDIWFEGNIHWNGTIYKAYMNGWPLMPNGDGWQVNKMWGSSSNDLYAVGNNGNIAHYSNGSWTKIESGTDVNLLDIVGTNDGKTIWTCGYTDDYGTSVLIRINNRVPEKIYEGSSNNQSNGNYVGPMSGVWINNNYSILLLTWGGLYLQKNNPELFLEKQITSFSDVGLGINGALYNNVFICGQRLLGHWNGYSFREFPEIYKPRRTFKSVNTRSNTVCAVGGDYNSPTYSNAVIVLGK